MTVKFVRLHPDVPAPTRAHPTDAGVDLTAYTTPAASGGDQFDWETVTISPQARLLIGTGVAVAIPEGYVGLLFGRSSMGLKLGLDPANAVGVIDSDYRGEIKICLRNTSNVAAQVRQGDRIGQLVVVPVDTTQWEEATKLPDTQRGAGGFGSTGA